MSIKAAFGGFKSVLQIPLGNFGFSVLIFLWVSLTEYQTITMIGNASNLLTNAPHDFISSQLHVDNCMIFWSNVLGAQLYQNVLP